MNKTTGDSFDKIRLRGFLEAIASVPIPRIDNDAIYKHILEKKCEFLGWLESQIQEELL